MTALLEKVERRQVQRTGPKLIFERKDIRFSNVGPDLLRLSVDVTNTGDAPSRPDELIVHTAPLGAFVPTRPLLRLALPSIGPRRSTTLTVEIAVPAAKPLGPPDRVPPSRLLTALDLGDRSSKPRRRVGATAGTALDLMALMGRRNSHFAGNFNIFLGNTEVERHLAQAVRIYPGRTNMAMFVMGDRPDAYAFELAGPGAAWSVNLFDGTHARSVALVPRDGQVVSERNWFPVQSMRMMFLAIEPPEGCGAGELEVHITQRSTQKAAVVEFSLDPYAVGPGCFVVP